MNPRTTEESRPRAIRRLTWLVCLPAAVVPIGSAEAQVRSCSAAPSAIVARSPDVIEGWEAVGATAAVGGVALVDQPVRGFLQSHQTAGLESLARIFRRYGTAQVYGGVTLAILGTGLISRNTSVEHAGLRLSVSYASTLVVTEVLKHLVGRRRPDVGQGAFAFRPFHRHLNSFPSGHTATAFALAATLSDELESRWASVGLYTIAVGTAWSRMDADRHWLSDVTAGALIGLTAAKVVNGRWRMFDLRFPAWLEKDGPTDPNAALGRRTDPLGAGLASRAACLARSPGI